MRTEAEVTARYEQLRGDDLFGFSGEVLLSHVSAEAAKPYLKDDADLSAWVQLPLDHDAVLAEVAEYMTFAWGKVQDHRGISAARSVDKISAYAWLLGRDDVVQAMEGAGYAQYGAPKLLVACKLLQLPWPEATDVQRMAEGLRCRPDCYDGCGT